jgi:hypothetical protein
MKIWVTLLLSVYLGAANAQYMQTMQRLPDTGQTQSYTSTSGEDNDYTINAPGFIINGDGTVTDTITGLMWQQTDGGEMTYASALQYADSLSLGTFTNWRLPSAHESFSMLNHQQVNPALATGIFMSGNAEYWWSSDQDAQDANKIWVTNAGGGIGNHPKSETISAGGTKSFHVRAVREQQNPILLSSAFSNAGNGIIHDNRYGVDWTQTPYPDSLTWEDALQYADTLQLAGYSDWRLPNIKECQSIIDITRSQPAVDISLFPNIGSQHYWSSTSLPNQTTKAWYLDTHNGLTTYQSKTSRLSVILVRTHIDAPNLTLSPMKSNDLIFYPNPVVSAWHISGNDNIRYTQLYSAQGKLIQSVQDIEKLNLSTLPAGYYVLHVVGNQDHHFSFIKQ